MNNLKIGDKVILSRCDDEDKKLYEKYLGRVFTIDSIGGTILYFKETNNICPYMKNVDKLEYPESYDFVNAPLGTKLTFRNGVVLVKDGIDHYENSKIVRCTNTMIISDIIKIEEPQYNIVYIEQKDILDADDKRYIKSIIRPFKDRVKYITKRTRDLTQEFISITLNDNFIINLPFFEKGTMYENMEADKLYTLEDLNI